MCNYVLKINRSTTSIIYDNIDNYGMFILHFIIINKNYWDIIQLNRNGLHPTIAC